MTHPSICIWVDITPKREKIAEKCIFPLCNTENAISKYQKRGVMTAESRQPGREEGEREGEEKEEEKKKKTVEGEN